MFLHKPPLFLLIFSLFQPPVLFGEVQFLVHRDGCHRWHSCPSDRGTYTCGDRGRCSECPDNPYCKNGDLRPASGPINREKNSSRPEQEMLPKEKRPDSLAKG